MKEERIPLTVQVFCGWEKAGYFDFCIVYPYVLFKWVISEFEFALWLSM